MNAALASAFEPRTQELKGVLDTSDGHTAMLREQIG